MHQITTKNSKRFSLAQAIRFLPCPGARPMWGVGVFPEPIKGPAQGAKTRFAVFAFFYR
ncbi:hypothetical protein X474_26125 [Dethiosulfatarculus sandiegensis]|uniref:Uncharacterized protein n=1 Tax=Dethiosulfatarculus sandiegensis TaxID=1429043 RepID=A0A0D2HKT0_9BACT|nr:hypothetical protein X474_26125 [Dethiosulfatarculus sandiegensis]